MSLFDTVTIECELPPTAPNWLKRCPVFQTSDLGQAMGDYTITKDRSFLMVNSIIGSILSQACDITIKALPIRYKRKRLSLYATNLRGGRPVGKEYCHFTDNGDPYVWITYTVWIYNGKAGPIRETSRCEKPARPVSEM